MKMALNGGFKRTFNTRSSSVNTQGLSEEVSSALQSLPMIQQSLQDIQQRLTGLEELRSELLSVKESLKEDLWGDDGIEQKIIYIAQQSEDTEQNVEEIQKENKTLRREVDLLKAIVIKLDRKVTEQDREITDLKGRSMRDNLMIHRFRENSSENLIVDIPKAIKKEYGVDLKFVRIHRIGPPRRGSDQPRPIVGKLENPEKKEEILRIQREFRQTLKQTPFYVSAQSPAAQVEERKHLYELQQKYSSHQNVKTRIHGNKLVFKNNGTVYREKVLVPRAEDVLRCDNEEIDRLEGIKVTFSDEKRERGNTFVASGITAKTYGEVRNFYKKICSLPRHAQAHHRILIYRFHDRDGKLIEGSMDDGEFGAGRNLLKHLEQRGHCDIACVVTRWYGGEHLGVTRFEMMRELVEQVAQQIEK